MGVDAAQIGRAATRPGRQLEYPVDAELRDGAADQLKMANRDRRECESLLWLARSPTWQ